MAWKGQAANLAIVELVRKAVDRFPDWRFHQILQNIQVEEPAIDQWYEESTETLSKATMATRTMENIGEC